MNFQSIFLKISIKNYFSKVKLSITVQQVKLNRNQKKMSSGPQFQNYTEINLNAIKNTKLFQKFMQNKSGILNSNAFEIIDKESNTKKQANIKQNKPGQKKPAIHVSKDSRDTIKNTRQTNLTLRQLDYLQNGSLENREYEKLKSLRSNNSQSTTVGLKLVENSYVEPYQRVFDDQDDRPIKIQQNCIERSHECQYHPEYKSQLQENSYSVQLRQSFGQQQQNNSSVINKRKRNFISNLQSSKQNPRMSEKDINTSSNSQSQNNPYEDSQSFLKVNILNNLTQQNSSEKSTKFCNKSLNEQKSTNPDGSSGRNTISVNYLSSIQKPANHQTLTPFQSIPLGESQYKQRYQTLLKKHQELKQQFKNENKNHKKQFNDWQHQIQIIKEKLFDVQSREDSLMIENQRLKEKCESQSLLKMKCQEQNKELGYKIKELEDQLIMKENTMKHRVDETGHWKTIVEGLKQQLHATKLSLQKRTDEYNLLFGDYQLVKKQRDNKDYLLEDLRRNITALVQQNSAAKDQLFKLVSKLYHLEQENVVLKNDLKRQGMDNSHLNNYMKDLQQQSTVPNREKQHLNNFERPYERSEKINQKPNQRYDRPYERYQQSKIQRNLQRNQSFSFKESISRPSISQQDKPNTDKQTRRRGQFARERGQVTKIQKPQRDQKPLPNTQKNSNMTSIINEQRPINQQKQLYPSKNKVGRINEICEELQKIKDMKAMNGAIRRKKIDLERELQQLESQ